MLNLSRPKVSCILTRCTALNSQLLAFLLDFLLSLATQAALLVIFSLAFGESVDDQQPIREVR